MPLHCLENCYQTQYLLCYLISFFKNISLKKYKFIYFNWRLITLQYCIGFAIHQHESATGILFNAFLLKFSART